MHQCALEPDWKAREAWSKQGGTTMVRIGLTAAMIAALSCFALLQHSPAVAQTPPPQSSSAPPSPPQSWPTRPVTMVGTCAAGGMTGAARVAKAAPDGYQFVLGNVGTHAQNQTLYKNPSYNAVTDFAPVGLLVDLPMLMIARTTLPPNDLKEFIAYAKVNQAKMQYASAGTGAPTHLACALLNAAMGVNITHVPYRGSAPALQDMIAGRIDYHCLNASAAIPHLEGKTAKAITMTTRERSATFPTIPTAREQGLKDFVAENWLAFFFPKGVPPEIVRRLNEAAIEAITTPAVMAQLKKNGADVVAPERRAPEYLQKFVASEIEKWASPIKAAGLVGN
jgi:tripartite-type tricarboxylate transporter receptor subunit TctC